MDRRNFLAGMAATAAVTAIPGAGRADAAAMAEVRTASTHSFPPEWAPHDAVWMGWDDSVTASPDHARLRVEMIKALSPHVPVHMIVDGDATTSAITTLLRDAGLDQGNGDQRVVFHVQDTFDVWTRDCGPLFVSDGRTLELAAFAWANYGFPWPYTNPGSLARGALDQELGRRMGYPMRTSDVVTEGGGLEVNTRTLVTYRDAMMQRNPGKDLNEIEAELKRLYGKDQVIWLDRAPITDRVLQGPKVANFFGWGANGHVDEYVRFVSEDTILVGEVSEAERDANALMRLDHEILTENRRQLEAARDPDGRRFNVVPMPVPDVRPFLRRRALTESDFQASPEGYDRSLFYRDFDVDDEVIEVPAVSYLNFLVTNGVVLSARYGGEGRPDQLAESDETAAALLKQCFPDREIVKIDPLAANWNGGGMHCLTQQQPRIAGSVSAQEPVAA